MLKIENFTMPEHQWQYAIKSINNGKESGSKWFHFSNSWEPSLTDFTIPCLDYGMHIDDLIGYHYVISSKDEAKMWDLVYSGSEHAKYRRIIIVYLDITAPLYWWSEFDSCTRETGGCSHSIIDHIHEKEFTWDDFSHEHLINFGAHSDEHGFMESSASYAHAKMMGLLIESLNGAKQRYLDNLEKGPARKEQAKEAWYQIIQLLPSSYTQKRTVMLSYEDLSVIYPKFKESKLDECSDFCNWIRNLPLACKIIV